MQGNKLNLTVSPTIFTAIQNLQAFTADASIETMCTHGGWQAAHGVKFCVIGNGASTAGMRSLCCP